MRDLFARLILALGLVALALVAAVAIALVIAVFPWAVMAEPRDVVDRDDPVDLLPPPLSAAEQAVSRETREGP